MEMIKAHQCKDCDRLWRYTPEAQECLCGGELEVIEILESDFQHSKELERKVFQEMRS